MDSRNTHFLTSVSYLPEKRQIVAEFSNIKSKQSRRFIFFPKIKMAMTFIPEHALSTFLSGYDHRKFKLENHLGILTITCSTFQDAKAISKLISGQSGLSLLLMPPERQFLIEKQWSYFDAFDLSSENPEKMQGLKFPETQLEGFIGTTTRIFTEMKSLGTGNEESFLEKIALSSILSLSPESVPESRFEQAEIFLENIFSNAGFASKSNLAKKTAEPSPQINKIAEKAGIDFENVWRSLLTKPFFNIGPDSFMCACCAPKTFNEKYVLPSSIVKVEFIADGIYYESRLDSWASKFHLTAPLKKEREKYAKDNFLNKIWPGPFFAGDVVELPLADAKYLSTKKLISPGIAPSKLLWFCQKKESALSGAIIRNELDIKALASISQNSRNISIVSNGLSFSNVLSKDIEFLYINSVANQKSLLLSQLLKNMLSTNSRFYNEEIAAALLGIQENILLLFREFAENKGFKPVKKNETLSLGPGNYLLLTKSFSNEFTFPKPDIL